MSDRWEDYFAPDESLLWQGAPFSDKRIGVMMLFLAVIGAVFCVFGAAAIFDAFRRIMALQIVPGIAIFPFGVFLFGVGVLLIVGPWYQKAFADRHILYALTNKKAYVATRFLGRRLETMPIAKDDDIILVDEHTVLFHTQIKYDSKGRARKSRRGFENISDAAKVFALLRGIQAEAT
ncbi:hypothetical protein N9L47_01735 [Rhodobacteraceae bacterium]|nr:hypothetical protein [Paracoccaceae bacterium]